MENIKYLKKQIWKNPRISHRFCFTEVVELEVSKGQIDRSGYRVGMMMNVPQFGCDEQIFWGSKY